MLPLGSSVEGQVRSNRTESFTADKHGLSRINRPERFNCAVQSPWKRTASAVPSIRPRLGALAPEVREVPTCSVICGTTPVDVKDILGLNTKHHIKKPKPTGENREKTGKKP